MRVERELMRGAGPVAVLRLLSTGERYGYELVQLLDARSAGVLAMGQSTLYPLLYNLQAKGLIASRVEKSESGRPRKYYRLTDKGKKRLAKEQKQWQALSAAMGQLGILGELTMADSIEPGWVTRVRFTPLSELLRGDVNGRLHWRHVIATSDLPAPIASLVLRVTRRTRLWRRERRAVAEELIAHFRDGLEAGETGEKLVDRFGDERAAAGLIRRGVKRNRPLIWHAWSVGLFAVRVALLIYAVFVVRFLISRPTVATNYLAELNAPNAAVQEPDRAWPLYRRAILALNVAPINQDKLLKQTFDSDGVKKSFLELAPSDAKWPQLAHWIDAHAKGVQLVRDAADKPAMGFILGPDGSQDDPDLGWYDGRAVKTVAGLHDSIPSDAIISIRLPMLNYMRTLASVLEADVRCAEVQHDGTRVVADVEAMLGIAGQQRDPIFVTRLIRMGIDDQAFGQIERLLRVSPGLFKDEQLTHLAHRVSAVGGESASSLVDLAGEQAEFHDLVQRIYSDDGHGNGVLTLSGARTLLALSAPLWADLDISRLALGISVSPMISRRAAVEEFDGDISLLNRINARPLYDPSAAALQRQYQQRVSAIRTLPLSGMRYFPLAILMPSCWGQTEWAERTLGRRDGVELGLGLEVYRHRQGRYPQTLHELLPLYIPRLPVDRITGDPLKYRLIDARPVVYSVGADRKDDGGRVPILQKKPDNRAAAQWFVGMWDKTKPADGDWVLFDLRPPAAGGR